MATFSPEELNYFKLCTVVLDEFPIALRQVFLYMWDTLVASKHGGQKWDHSGTVLNLFPSNKGGAAKKTILNKSIEELDCTALFQVTLFDKTFAMPDGSGGVATLHTLYVPRRLPSGTFHPSVLSPSGIQAETFALALNQLRLLRNTLCHQISTKKIDKTTLDKFLLLAKEAFAALGQKTFKVDDIGKLGEEDFPTAMVQRLEDQLKRERAAAIKYKQIEDHLNQIESEVKDMKTGLGNEVKEIKADVQDIKQAIQTKIPVTHITKEEGQISAESKEGSSCSTSQLPKKMDHPADQKRTNSEVSCGRDGVDKCISQRTSQELHPSTSLDAAQSRSGHSAETLQVALLAKEWGSFKGGLSTINRTLAILLAKHSEVNATLLVPQFVCSEEDKRTAQSHNISIREAQRRPGFSDPLDWLSFPPRDLTFDIVIGHGAKLGKQAQVIRESHRCKWVQVVHTVPEELAMHKNYLRAIAKGEEKNRAEVDLCKLADLVVAVGPKLAQAFSSCLRSSHQDVFQLTPGIFADFADVKHSVQEAAKFKVLMFGRGDSEDLGLKGYDIAASAIVELKDSSYRLIFVGAPDGKQDAVAETLLKTGISKNQLIVRSYVQDKERLKELFSQSHVAIMPSRTEGFGLTALEAMSAGLPILVSGNSGFGEALRGLPFGMSFLIESDDPKDWAKAIAALRHKPRTQRFQEIQKLQRSYEEAYNWETQCKSLVERMWKTVYGVEKPTKHKSPVKNCTGDDTAGQTASDTHLPQDMSKEGQKVEISAESKKVSSCSTSPLPESMDHPGRSRFCGECDEILTKFHKFWQCTNHHTTCDDCAVDHWWDTNSYTCTHHDCKEPLHLVHPSDTTRELVCVFVDTNNLAEKNKVALDIRKVIDTVANNREVAMVTLYRSDVPSSSDSVLDKESECEWTLIIRETYAKTYLVTDIVKVVSDKSLKKGKIVIVNGDPYMIPAIEKGLSKNWPFEIYMCKNRIPIELKELQHENASMLKIFSLESVAQSVNSPSYAEDAKRVKIGLNVQPDVL